MEEITKRINDTIKNQLFFEKENIKISSRVLKVINELYPKIEILLEDYYNKKISKKVLDEKIKVIIDIDFKDLSEYMKAEALTVIQQETTKTGLIIAASAFAPNVPKVTKETLRIIQNNIISKNKFFTVEFTKYKKIAYSKILLNVNLAVLNLKTYKEAAASIKQVKELNNNQLASVTRTMMRSIQTDAAFETYKRNGIKLLKFVATLDDRTTEVCKDLNDKVFTVKEAPRLPLHYNCRSHYIAIFEEEEEEFQKREISWAKYYEENKNDPDLKRLKYIYGVK